jgi:hypothetical protein
MLQEDSLTVQRRRFSAWTFQRGRFSATTFQRVDISAHGRFNAAHFNSHSLKFSGSLILGYLIVY